MTKEGSILYFPEFFFKNGNPSKPKYFIVLKYDDQGRAILASLPSSKDHLPSFEEIRHGCLNSDRAQMNCYIFMADNVITDCGWSFPLNTFVYGNQIDAYELDMLEDVYPVEESDWEIVGLLTSDEYTALISCLANSPWVKRKYKKML